MTERPKINHLAGLSFTEIILNDPQGFKPFSLFFAGTKNRKPL
jgi:hypothetical protein